MSSAERYGVQGTGVPFVQPKHWVVHHPIFTKHPKAMVVYMRLRAAFFEGDDQIRVMTNDQIARIVDLPVSTVRDALRYLTQAGLLVRVNPEKKNAVPVRRFVDEVPAGYDGVINGLRHRDEVLTTERDGKRETGITGDGSSAPSEEKSSDQDFFQEGDGSSAPGDGSSAPGDGSSAPKRGKSAGHSAGPGPQEASYQEASFQETLSPASPEAALAGGESVPRQGGDPVFEELLRQFGGAKTQQEAEPAIALPGGTALVAGEVVGAPTAWQEGNSDNEEDW